MAYFPRDDAEGLRSNLWLEPRSPDDDDDEALGSALSADWALDGGSFGATVIDTYDNTFTSGDVRQNYNDWRPSWHLVQPPGDGNVYYLTKSFTMSTPVLVYAHLRGNLPNTIISNDGNIGLVVGSDSAGSIDTNNHIRVWLRKTTPGLLTPELERVQAGVTTTIAQASSDDNCGHAPEYAALHYDGTTFRAYFGARDSNWQLIGSTTHSDVGNFGRAGIIMQNSAGPANVFGWNFVRFLRNKDTFSL